MNISVVGEGVSFNEASALQRRKRRRLDRAARLGVASMRPPLFSGGNHQGGSVIPWGSLLQ